MLSRLMNEFRRVDVLRMRDPEFLKRQDEIERGKLEAIRKGGGWRRVDRCPLCGAGERAVEFAKHGVDIARCGSCGTRYGTQVPANLEDVYKSPAYVVFSKADTEEHYQYRRERFGRERVSILERYCGDLREKRLLDVGCGNGYFLSVAAEKCRHCFGTEFSDKLREFTQEKTGCTVYNKTLEELPAEGFDIVTLFDVIEHILDPLAFMRSVNRILAPGGHVLIFTPNFDSFGIRVMKTYSSIIDPTEHVVLFTMDSLNLLAEKLGCSIVYAETQGLDVANILAMQQFKGEKPDAFLVEWGNELQAMINQAGCGDYGRILYRKP